MDMTVAISFSVQIVALTLIGLYAASRKRGTAEDYLLAGRNVSPGLVALSAAATTNSGVMFVGLIGQTYQQGISVIWILIGSVLGDYSMWRIGVHRGLRIRSERAGTLTVASFMGHGVPGGRRVTVLAGLFTVVFLGGYAATQLSAGSKALHTIFGWSYGWGALVGAVAVALYCFAGGIRASIWTDVAQSVVMMTAMFLLVGTCLHHIGGVAALWTGLAAIDPQLVCFFPEQLPLGVGLFLFGWLAGGFAAVGQPHMIVRAMTIDTPQNMHKARRIYVIWYGLFAAMTVIVGLSARVILTSAGGFDAELALPMVASELLPGVLVGVILAGLFSAVMSTADSQLIACSAALTQDIFPAMAKRYWVIKGATLLLTGIVLLVAIHETGVFELSFLAWSFLGAVLTPLLVLRAFGRDVSGNLGVAMMLAGAGGVLTWRYGLGYSAAVYDVLPGMVAGITTYLTARALARVFPSLVF